MDVHMRKIICKQLREVSAIATVYERWAYHKIARNPILIPENVCHNPC